MASVEQRRQPSPRLANARVVHTDDLEILEDARPHGLLARCIERREERQQPVERVLDVTAGQVEVGDGELTSFIKRNDLSRDRSEQRPERYNVGDKVDAAVLSVDKASRRIAVSIKALEIAEEKQAVAQYGSSDSGASLGDIFKAAIKKREGSDDDGDE